MTIDNVINMIFHKGQHLLADMFAKVPTQSGHYTSLDICPSELGMRLDPGFPYVSTVDAESDAVSLAKNRRSGES